MAADPATHSFRYELGLCTVPEGQTLEQWRRDPAAEPDRPSRRARLRDRLRPARRQSAR